MRWLPAAQPPPGVVLPMIAALAAPVPRRQPPASVPDPAAVDLLLETAFTTFRAGFLASQVAAMMRSRASDPVAIEQINRREVAAHRAEAAASAGLARQAHLADAIEIASSPGLTDTVREVTAELQAIPVNDLGLRRHSTSVRVPADQVKTVPGRLHGKPGVARRHEVLPQHGVPDRRPDAAEAAGARPRPDRSASQRDPDQPPRQRRAPPVDRPVPGRAGGGQNRRFTRSGPSCRGSTSPKDFTGSPSATGYPMKNPW